MKLYLLTILLSLFLLGGSDKCATATINLPIGVISPGDTITIPTKVFNCGTKQANFALKVTVTDACGGSVVALDTEPSDGKLQPGAAFIQSAYYTVSTNACLGTYTVTAIVSSNNASQGLPTTTTTFQVQ